MWYFKQILSPLERYIEAWLFIGIVRASLAPPSALGPGVYILTLRFLGGWLVYETKNCWALELVQFSGRRGDSRIWGEEGSRRRNGIGVVGILYVTILTLMSCIHSLLVVLRCYVYSMQLRSN